jgi:DNA polymerase III gamma/tau subunit
MSKKNDLCAKHRPDRFDLMVGQETAARSLAGLKKRKGGYPPIMMFSGPTGTGKTTAALIVGKDLGCSLDDQTLIIHNAGMEGGKDVIKDLDLRLQYRPLLGKRLLFVFDECQGLTKPAQEALLLPTENPPDWCHMIFCTTDPQKILPTLKGRCTEVKFSPVAPTPLAVLVNQISKREGFKPGEKLVKAIVEAADGSARKAVKELERVMAIPDKKARIAAVASGDAKVQAIDLCRLIAGRKGFAACAKILANLQDDPEKVRRLMLSYANSMLLKGNTRGAHIIRYFQYNVYESGAAGLSLACFLACSGK